MDELELRHEDYTVGWVCPLEVELIAALEMLDRSHKPLAQAKEDSNAYHLGEINGHNVVVATLPVTGSFLWLHGKPGCGKTVLCASTINSLERNIGPPSKTVFYFFFTFSDESKRSVRSMLCSFIFNLYHKFKARLKIHLSGLLESCKDGFQPELGSLLHTLHLFLDEVQDVTFVLDALDECGTLDDLLLWLRGLQDRMSRSFHVIMTSRREEKVEALFNEWNEPQNILKIPHHLVNKDIHAFVEQSIQNTDAKLNPKYYKLAERLKYWEDYPQSQTSCHSIGAELMKKAGGM